MAHALACRSEPVADHPLDDINERALAQLARGKAPWLSAAWLVAAGAMCSTITASAPCDADDAFLDLFAATGIAFRLGAARTFYSRVDDMIALADWRSSDPISFLRDWIHELLHAVGHPSRLGRDLPLAFGSNAHGLEDLIAEIGTAIVCVSLGIEPALRHPECLGGWAGLLHSDRRILGNALRQARHAADHLFVRRDAQVAAVARFAAAEARAAREEAPRSDGRARKRRDSDPLARAVYPRFPS